MPSLSGLKNSVISALRTPHETNKSRLRRRVIPFNEALQNLRTSETGFVTCAAFHSFGKKCRKEVALGDSSFLTNLDQLNMTDVQTPIKLMPMMLCSNHWEKTIYYNALFLDWLSVYGSQRDTQYLENIVIDYQSAIAIENEEQSLPQIPVSPVSIAAPERRPASAPCSLTRDGSHTKSTPTKDQSQPYIYHGEAGSLEPEFDPSGYQPQTSVLVNMESYASIEFGVAKLEILYQEKLRCIAMSSDGWRCQEIISEEHLLKARELVSSSAISGAMLDIAHLLGSVLCPGHALGQLPRLYSEKWARFSEQRLSKDEAILMFDADVWMSVEFFHSEESGQPSVSTKMRKPRLASKISALQSAKHGQKNKDRIGGHSLWPPPEAPLVFQGQCFQFGVPDHSSNTEGTAAARVFDSEEVWPLLVPKTASADHQSTGPAHLETSTTAGLLIPEVVEPLRTSKSLEDKTSAVSNLQHTDTSALLSLGLAKLGITPCEPPRPDADKSSLLEAAAEEPILPNSQVCARDDHPTKAVGPFASKGADQPSLQTHSQEVIDRNLIKEMTSVFPPQDCVYIRKSLDGNEGRTLVKIGKGTGLDLKDINRARTDAGCQLLGLDLMLVDLIHVNHPERAVKLVYAELENFRAKIDCQHPQSKATSYACEQEHSKWFDIPVSAAIASVRLWCDFVNEACNSAGTIDNKWVQMATLLPKPSHVEVQSLQRGFLTGDKKSIALHHELRNSRYKQWIRCAGSLLRLGVSDS